MYTLMGLKYCVQILVHNYCMKKEFLVWQISREYANIAEAGGVKNVVAALAEGLKHTNWNTCVFLPLYGCTDLSVLQNFKILPHSVTISVNGSAYSVQYAKATYKSIPFIFIINQFFTEKLGVYTYTAREEQLHKNYRRGEGHKDVLFLNILFQKAVLEYGVMLKNTQKLPRIIHCHDAPTALIPFFARTMPQYSDFYKNVHFVATIHNAGLAYHHAMYGISTAISLLESSRTVIEHGIIDDRVEPFLLCESFAQLTTVSPWYANELKDAENSLSGGLSLEFCRRNTSILGITNGIEYANYNPQKPEISMLPYSYNPQKKILSGKYRCRHDFLNIARQNFYTKLDVLQHGYLTKTELQGTYFVFHGRLVEQKGIAILLEAIDFVLQKTKNAYFVVIGQGQDNFEIQNIEYAKRYAGNFLFFQGYSRSLSRLCVAMADYIILPSLFEPCGLEDLIAQIYGTIPIAHKVGGLQKIVHGTTGYLYEPNTAPFLGQLLYDLTTEQAVNTDIIVAAAQSARTTYSWKKIIEEQYLPLYNSLF